MAENKSYMQHAMLLGTYMGGFWILKFVLFPLGLSVPFLFLLFIGLTLCVPFVGFRYVRKYRDTVCEGHINFLQGWMFTVFMYLFAALLTAVGHYIYFRFIDHGFVIDAYEAQVKYISQNQVAGMEAYTDMLHDALDQARTLTPIDIVLQLFSQNIFIGTMLAFPTALFAMKRKKEQ